VTLTWDPPAVTGGGLLGYDVEVARDSGDDSFSSGLTFSIGGPEIDTTKTTATRTIEPGIKYDFNIIAVNAFGQSNLSNTAHAAIVTRPGRPLGLQLLKHHNEIGVFWQPPNRDGGTTVHYRVQYATCVPGAKGCHFSTKHTEVPFVILMGLKKHTTYHVRLIAANRKGLGPPSKVKSIKTGA
jgi:hypothetical protein